MFIYLCFALISKMTGREWAAATTQGLQNFIVDRSL
jgi:hypothetical protein